MQAAERGRLIFEVWILKQVTAKCEDEVIGIPYSRYMAELGAV